MCGIAGFCNLKDEWKSNIDQMNHRMSHRGPDASGVWTSENKEVVLGHQRLSIMVLNRWNLIAGVMSLYLMEKYITIRNWRVNFWMKKRICRFGVPLIQKCF